MDKKLLGLIFVFFIVFLLFLSAVIFNQSFSRFTRASEHFIPSVNKSLIFAWPLDTKINNQVTVNVFIRNEKGIPLANKSVLLKTTIGNISPNPVTTDKSGKASSILTSSTSGTAQLSAIVENSYELNQKVSVKFE